MTSGIPPAVMDEIKEGRVLATSAPRLIAVLEAVAAVYHVGKLDIVSPNRRPHMVATRNAFYWSAKNLTPRGYSEIGRFINRDHSTVMHGIKNVETFMASYAPKLRMVVHRLNLAMPDKLNGGSNG